MLPLARELLKKGTEVAPAANTPPSINDITLPSPAPSKGAMPFNAHWIFIYKGNHCFLSLQGMLPLARELLKRGTEVVLAANTLPSINDITAAELKPLVAAAADMDHVIRRAAAEQTLRVVESGNDMPVIDLRRVSGLGAGGGKVR